MLMARQSDNQTDRQTNGTQNRHIYFSCESASERLYALICLASCSNLTSRGARVVNVGTIDAQDFFVSATVLAIQTCFLWTRCHWCQSVHSESILFRGCDFGACKNQSSKSLVVHLSSLTIRVNSKGALVSDVADSSSQNTMCCCWCHSIHNTHCLQKLVIYRKLIMPF